MLATTTVIIDNSASSPQHVRSGSWVTSTGVEYGGSIASSVSPFTGSDIADWWFSGIDPGQYRVSATWHAGLASQGSNVPITVYNGQPSFGGVVVGSGVVNQQVVPNDFQDAGVYWENIGVFTTATTQLGVRMTDLSNGSAIADAIRIERIVATTDTAIIDNEKPGFSKSGTWAITTGMTGAYGGTISSNTLPNDGSEVAEWTFNVAPGMYRLSTSLPSGASTYGANNVASVYNGAQLLGDLTLDQTVSYSDYYLDNVWWKHLGTFSANSTLRVRMTDLANGSLIADAFRIQRVADPTPVPITTATSIAIVNPSFESQTLANGSFGPIMGTITAWGNGDLLNPGTTHFPGGLASDGQNVATSPFNNGSLSQTLTHIPLPNKEYRLQVDVGDRLDKAMGGWRIELRSNSQTLAAVYSESLQIADGTYSTAELTYTTSDTPPTGPWQIVLLQSGSVPNSAVTFDNVRLTMRDARFSAPTAVDDLLYYTPTGIDLTVGTASSLVLNDTQFEGTGRFASIDQYPAHGIISSFGADGTFVYKPDPAFIGTDTFTYRVHNGGLQSAAARVQVSVGTRLLPRLNYDSNVFNSTPLSSGFGIGYSNVPTGSSMDTDGALAKTGGLVLAEDILPGMSLIYRSDDFTRPIIEVESQFAIGQPVPATIFAQLVFNGVAYPASTYSTSGLVAGDRFRIALQPDNDTLLPTGRYSYQVNLSGTSPSFTESFTGKKTVINRSQSPFGRGWSLDGLDRVQEEADGLLLVRGNGDFLWFPKQGSSFGFADGDTSFLKAIKNPDGTFALTSKEGLVLSFNQLGLLVSTRDRSSNVYTFTYADRNEDTIANELISLTEPYGRVISLAYTNGKVSSLQHFSNRTTQLTYSGSDLSGYTLTDPDGVGALASPAVVFAYPTKQLVRTNAVGQVTTYTFGSHGRLTKVNYANSDEWQLQAEETIALPTAPVTALQKANDIFAIVTDGNNIGTSGPLTWKFQTDRFGNVTKSVTTLGNTRTYLRNANGQLYEATEPDPDNDGDKAAPITKIGYNTFGDVTLLIAPDGGTSKLKYTDQFRQPILVVDPVGRTNRSLYDGLGNELQSIDGAGYITQRVFNARGQATQVTSPDPDAAGPQTSQVTTYGYDSFGRLATVTLPNGGTNTLAYTPADELGAVFDELSKFTTWNYDSLGRNISRQNRVNAIEQTKFDALSRPVQLIDPLGKVTDVTYDLRERVETITYPDPSVPGISLPRPINVFAYDKNSNLVASKNPDSYFVGDMRYTYNPEDLLYGRSHSAFIPVAGNPTAFETYEYDNIGRLSKVNRVKGDLTEDYSGSVASGLSGAYVVYTYDSVGRIDTEEHYGLTPDEFYSLDYDYSPAGELIKRTDNDGNVASNVYDSRGLLVQETSPDPDQEKLLFSLITRYTYDALGRLTTVDNGFGRVSSYEYNNRNWLTKVTEPDPDGTGPLTSPVNQFSYNLRGDQLSETSPLGRVTSFGYDDEQRFVSRLDPDPDTTGPLTSPFTMFQYDLADRLIGVINPRGASSAYSYDSLGRPILVTSPDPDDAGPLTSPTTTYVYNERGLQSIIDPLGRISATFQLDKAGRSIAVTDTAGQTTNYSYNFYDQVLKTISPDPDGGGPLPRSTEELQYDWDGRLSRRIDAEGGITQWKYDVLSNVAQIIDPRSNTTTFEYDGLNRVSKESKTVSTYGTNPTTVEATRSYQYDVAGNLTRAIDRNGRVTQLSYDKLDRVTAERWMPSLQIEASVTELTDGSKQNEIQKVGWTAATATSLSGTFQLSLGTSITAAITWNATDATIRAALEAIPQIGVGNVDVTVSNVAIFGREITISFKNALSGVNLAQVVINTASLVASPGGVVKTQQTVTQGSTTLERQRLTLPFFGNTSNPQGVWYLAFGSEISGPLAVTGNPADIANALNAFVGIDSVTVTGVYPNFDVTFGGTQAGLSLPEIRMDTNNLYQSMNVSRTINSTYNAEDELVTVSDPSATINFTRDSLGRATTIQNQIGDVTVMNGVYGTFTFQQSFDAASNRTRLNAAHNTGSGFINDYTYDKLDRLTVIDQSGTNQAKRVKMTYNALGQRTLLERYESFGTTPVVANTSYTYDTANRLSRIEHSKGATIFNAHDYIFDGMSRIKSITSKIGTIIGQPHTVDFVYDKLSQLLSADDGTLPSQSFSQSFSYTYDANGNRNSAGYTNDVDNRVKTGPGGESYVYDLEGNLTEVRVNGALFQRYTWDHRNRLTEVKAANGSTIASYQYDAFNRLVTRSDTNGATTWGYDEGINPQLEATSQFTLNGLTHRYLWSDQVDELLADEQRIGTGTSWNTLWALSDHQGTVKDLLDYNPAGAGTSTIVNSRLYDAFGNLELQTGTATTPIGYTGKYFDQATGLQNSWNRWYSPKMGRFTSQDPIGFGGGDANLYRYVGNRVTTHIDPSGLVVVIVHGIANHNSDEIAEITRRINEYWDSIGQPRQEIVHFYYGVGPELTPVGIGSALQDTQNNRNIIGGEKLNELLKHLSRDKNSLNSSEPISVVAYSNGTNLAWWAAKTGGFKADLLLLLGGSLDNDNDMSVFPKAFGKTINFTSHWDGPTWYTNGIGRYGLESKTFSEIRVPYIYHSLNEMEGKLGKVGNEWTSESYIRRSKKIGSFWLSAMMLKVYYRAYFAESGDGRISEFNYNPSDDLPHQHNVRVD